MGRYLSAENLGEVRAVAAGAFAAGDLMALLETGFATKCNAALGVGGNANATQGPAAVAALSSLGLGTNYGYGSVFSCSRMATLSDGNVAAAYSGNGTADSTGLTLRIHSPLGDDGRAPIAVSSATAIYGYRVRRVNDATLVVAWTESTTLKIAFYANDGTVVAAAATVAALVGFGIIHWNVAVTAAGDVVLAYAVGTTNDCAFSRYSAAGVLQGGATVVEAGASPIYLAVLGCANGDFVVAYRRTVATAGYKFARYTGGGVLLGAVTTLVNTGNSLSNGDAEGGVVELDGGNVVFATPGAADSYPDLHVYSAANALVKVVDLWSSAFMGGLMPQLMALAGGGFAVAGLGSSSNTSLATFDASGGGLLPVKTVDGGGIAPSTNGAIYAFSLGAAGFAFVRAAYDGAYYDARLFTCSPLGVATGTPVQLRTARTDALSNVAAVLTADATVFLSLKDNVSPYLSLGVYHVARKSVLGVALNAGTDGQVARVATQGCHVINQSFAAGGWVDGRTAEVPGPRGTVICNSATLLGLE